MESKVHSPSCFHNYLEIESDKVIEVAQEVDLCNEGDKLSEISCLKNPGHKDFIAFCELKLEDLPEKFKTQETLDAIKRLGQRVVRLVVKKRVNGRIQKEVGTGIVSKDLNTYFVYTNHHVVRSQTDVENCKVEFFYNSDRSNIFVSRGIKIDWTCALRDMTMFSIDRIPDIVKELNIPDEGMVSPDLCIIYNDGSCLEVPTAPLFYYDTLIFEATPNLQDPDIFIMFVKFVDGSIRYLTSPFITFQQIYSNEGDGIDKAEVHVNEGDGKSKVLSADITKKEENYLVQISELLSQDEAKKCVLMWKEKVVGRIGKLHFNSIDSKRYVRDDLKMAPRNVWLFGIKPYVTELQYLGQDRKRPVFGDDMCVIGHPHGNIKTVSFGIYIDTIAERFDEQNRWIKDPDEKCSCKEIDCFKYSCKTCPGSSGSPVFFLDNLSLYHYSAHFLGERYSLVFEDKMIENINTAWSS